MVSNQSFNKQQDSFRALLLFVVTLGNNALMFFANVVLARSLTISDFDDYSVAISIVTMLSTLATLGLEKYALRAIALFKERQDWQKFRGFWLFSIRIISAFSLLLFGLLSIGLEVTLAIHHADYHIAIVIFASFLPIIAITLFLVEFISVQGAQIVGIIIYRLFLPLVYLLLIYGIDLSQLQLTATTAVLAFGLTWTVTLYLIRSVVEKLMPATVKQASALILTKKWLTRSLPLVFNSLMLTVITSSGVVVLELLYPSGLEVGIYAVAAQIGSFISLIGTSTNRYYLPIMVVLIEHHDKHGIKRLIQKRFLVIGVLIFTLFAIIASFGHNLLNLFGSHYTGGYLPLVLIGAGASMSALYSDMPYYLQFLGSNKIVLSSTLLAMLMMLILSIILGQNYGAIGVAIAYMMSVFVLFISFRSKVFIHFKYL